ncbi:4870_t:CDS:2 [Acaulospora colombiana]|uniref:4870_t:CDS:1 n=1 Tax=Acaulospora colombiana TaxID=27376 RepID=A0ACA9K850_9GLOM|nr:4870_t:CDS:2 [Acaulospora colombiana]
MLSRLVREHNQKQQVVRRNNEQLRKEVIQSVGEVTDCLADNLNERHGEDVRVSREVTSERLNSKKLTAEKISKKQQKTRTISNATTGDSKTVNLVTGTPSELKPEEIVSEITVPSEPPVEKILNDESSTKEDANITHEVKPQEKEEKHDRNLEIVCPIEMRTVHEVTKESDMIPIEFHWKYGGNKVFVTGDFDGWKAQKHEMHLNPETNEFVAIVEIDRTKQHEFKFVVDGDWKCNWDFPTRYDERE